MNALIKHKELEKVSVDKTDHALYLFHTTTTATTTTTTTTTD